MKGTIKSKTDMERLFAKGRRFNTRNIVIIAMMREGKRDQAGRVAYIAGKKLGNAPQRNYAKRVMRQIIHEIGIQRKGVDVVFMARKSLIDAEYESVKNDCKKALEKVYGELGF